MRGLEIYYMEGGHIDGQALRLYDQLVPEDRVAKNVPLNVEH